MTQAADGGSDPIEAGTLFEELWQNAACGHVVMAEDYAIVDVNDTFVEWTGHPREELARMPFRDLLTAGSKLFYETRFVPVLQLGGEVREVALSLVRADGTTLPILVNARVVAPSDGKRGTLRLAIFDSTQREDYERELLAARRAAEASEQRLRVLQHAASAYAEAKTEAELADALVASGRDAFAASDAAVVLFTPEGGIRVASGAHLAEPLLALHAARPERSGVALQSSVVWLVDLVAAEAASPAIASILRGMRVEAASAVPLAGDDGPLGALILFYGRARQFDEPTVELHQALADQASLVLTRIRLQAELEQLAMHDQLTGLANRNLLRERLSHALAFAERAHQPVALIFLDLDGFKTVNDELGHRAGDGVLQAVATRIDSVVREADVVGRFGGDEFLVICEDADATSALTVATRITAAVAQPIDGLPSGITITASVGIAVYTPGLGAAPSNDVIVRAADAAMYESKNDSPGQITVREL